MSNLDIRRPSIRSPLEPITNRKRRKIEGLNDGNSNLSHQCYQQPSHDSSQREEEPEFCRNCKAEEEHIKILKEALLDVIEQNEILRTKVVELEAVVSETEDNLSEKNQLIAKLTKIIARLTSPHGSEKENEAFC